MLFLFIELIVFVYTENIGVTLDTSVRNSCLKPNSG